METKTNKGRNKILFFSVHPLSRIKTQPLRNITKAIEKSIASYNKISNVHIGIHTDRKHYY